MKKFNTICDGYNYTEPEEIFGIEKLARHSFSKGGGSRSDSSQTTNATDNSLNAGEDVTGIGGGIGDSNTVNIVSSDPLVTSQVLQDSKDLAVFFGGVGLDIGKRGQDQSFILAQEGLAASGDAAEAAGEVAIEGLRTAENLASDSFFTAENLAEGAFDFGSDTIDQSLGFGRDSLDFAESLGGDAFNFAGDLTRDLADRNADISQVAIDTIAANEEAGRRSESEALLDSVGSLNRNTLITIGALGLGIAFIMRKR